MVVTQIARMAFRRRQKQIALYATETPRIQQDILMKLLRKAQNTEYGRNHLFGSISSYEDFAAKVPVNTYEELKGDIDRMRHGEKDVLWPGKVQWYAKSSGTTNDKSKFIPVSNDGLHHVHYRGGTDCVALYLAEYPESRILDGKGLILGGSHAPNYTLPHSLVGDLSAILIENINPLVNLIRVPKKSTALLSDFELKRDRIAHEVIGQKVTNLSGVPSWMLSVLLRVLEVSGKSTIDEVWPDLEVFFHGGIAFTPYRRQYEQLIKSSGMHYMETYNASEGFFGIQNDKNDKSMLLMVDYEMFYEFCPMDAINDDGTVKDSSRIVPLKDVELYKNYAMIISNSNGLWRYLIGDTVSFTSRDPYKFIITGRTKSFINAFGEELIVDNAEKGVEYACRKTGAEVLEYTAAPVFMGSDGKCRHQWLVEFSQKPENVDAFAEILDKYLQQINSDYEAKRFKDITLQPLEMVVARKGLFNDWLKQEGKLGGQHKVPRLSNNRNIIEKLLKLNNESEV
jgi:hypothetical protein